MADKKMPDPKKGDIVRLNSDSPDMTVTTAHTDGQITVSWIGPEGQPYSMNAHKDCFIFRCTREAARREEQAED